LLDAKTVAAAVSGWASGIVLLSQSAAAQSLARTAAADSRDVHDRLPPLAPGRCPRRRWLSSRGVTGESERRPIAPEWFRRALAVRYDDEYADIDGCSVHVLAWGASGRRGLVFVHGGSAHAHWWTHVASTFADDFRVLAVDLSGHGDSGRRERYSLEQWTDEVVAVAAPGGDRRATRRRRSQHGRLRDDRDRGAAPGPRGGAIVCDSPVAEPDPEMGAYRRRQAFGRSRTYETLDDALSRFRTVPGQDHYLDYVMDHVARWSVHQVEGGWQWKFDPRMFAQVSGGMRAVALPYLSKVTCRFALLRSEFGLVTPTIGESMYERLGRLAPVIEIPEAGHHAMLDQPLLLITALRTLLADWDHSEPRRR